MGRGLSNGRHRKREFILCPRGLNQERFASRLAQILGTLNAVHAFREGNGRAQREFVRELAYKNSYWIDWNKVSREELYEASDASFMRGDNTLFEKLLRRAIEPIDRDRFPPPGARRTWSARDVS